MQNNLSSHFYSSQREKHDQQIQEITFQNFLLLVELKNHNKIKQKQLKIQQYKELKNRIQNKIKILPQSLAKSLEKYDSKVNEYLASKRISMQLPMKICGQNYLPKLKRNCNIQILPNLKKEYRKDEINSIRSFSFRINPQQSEQSELSKEQQKLGKPKVLVRKFKTDFCKMSRFQELKREISFKKIAIKERVSSLNE